MNIALSFDVEEDLHSPTFESLKLGIPRLLKILENRNIKVTFFVPAKLLEKFPNIFLKLEKQGHEIALHGYEHERFDDLSIKEKQRRIKESIKIYKKIFDKNPEGFRAPQHSIDSATLKLLKRNNFIYDSSYTPFNFLQLFFFPRKFKLWIKGFFQPLCVNKLEEGIYEIPISSFFVPFVSLTLRIFSRRILKIYLFFVKLFNRDIIFYAHSWDFIELPQSKIDRNFPYFKLTENLDFLINDFFKDKKFLRLEELI